MAASTEAVMRPSAQLEQAKVQLDQQGYCILPDLLLSEVLRRVRERIAEQATVERRSRLSGRDDAQVDDSNQYVYALINKGDVFVDLVLHPVILQLVQHLLGEEFLLSASDGILAHPGGSLAPLHTDQWWMPPPVPRGQRHAPVGSIQRNEVGGSSRCDAISPPVVCSIMWMVSPFTDENGGTRVVPGTHLSGALPEASIPHRVASIAACGNAGSAMVFDGRLWHSTGANRTDAVRIGIVTTYCGPQFRPMENYTIAAREALLAARREPMLRQLLGFKVWQGYGKMDNPVETFVDRYREPVGELRVATP
jgi:ectoine hydroxylase-related dioxygenase (phytanoyl-CoA dioxygenase family)